MGLVVLAMVIGLYLVLLNMRDALQPPFCPQCNHCINRRNDERRRQKELQDHADFHRLDSAPDSVDWKD